MDYQIFTHIPVISTTSAGLQIEAVVSGGVTESHAAFDSVMVYDPLVSLDQTTWGAIKSIF